MWVYLGPKEEQGTVWHYSPPSPGVTSSQERLETSPLYFNGLLPPIRWCRVFVFACGLVGYGISSLRWGGWEQDHIAEHWIQKTSGVRCQECLAFSIT